MYMSKLTWLAVVRACLCCCCIMAVMVLTAWVTVPSFAGIRNASYLVSVRHSESLVWGTRPHNQHPTSNNSNSPSNLRVFVGVVSHAGNFKARQVIRQGWAKDPALARVVFFVMRPDNTDVFYRVRQEAVAMGDVFVLSEVIEHYDRITYSTLALFKAAALNPNEYTHVVKTDDDIYVRPTLLLQALEDMPCERLYAGFPMTPGSVLRSGDWHVVPYEHWASDKRVRYGFGWGYVLTMDLAQEIAAGIVHLMMPPDNLLMIEDLAVGYWVDYVAQEKKFTINYNSSLAMGGDDCKEDFIFYHIKPEPQWRVLECMHEHGGHCCPSQ